MKQQICSTALLFILTLAGTGCATPSDKTLDQKMALEPPIQNYSVLTQEVQATIQNDPDLTPGQKTQLNAIREKANAAIKDLNQQSLKLRLILVKDFEAGNDLEIDSIHDRLVENHKKEISTIFDSLKQANKIVGHVPHDRKWMMEMFNVDRGHF